MQSVMPNSALLKVQASDASVLRFYAIIALFLSYGAARIFTGLLGLYITTIADAHILCPSFEHAWDACMPLRAESAMQVYWHASLKRKVPMQVSP